MRLITFLLLICLTVATASASFTGNRNPSIGSYIDTDGYTVPSGKMAIATPLHWNATVDSSEVCVVKKETIPTANVTSTNVVAILVLPFRQILSGDYDNVNVTITRASGTKTLNGYYVTGRAKSTQSAAITDYSIGASATVMETLFTNYKYGLVDVAQAPLNRDFKYGFMSAVAGITDVLVGTIPADTLNYYDDSYYVVMTSTNNTSTSFSPVIKYYKCGNIEFKLKAGQVLAGDRWAIAEYDL